MTGVRRRSSPRFTKFTIAYRAWLHRLARRCREQADDCAEMIAAFHERGSDPDELDEMLVGIPELLEDADLWRSLGQRQALLRPRGPVM